ncbi:hypothetical protein [Desulfobacca acetoxidans]|uniref:Uncharacterized protein n=1 Tax=Desulfobacca acetoxidans (strain ATCC 700848 / DSM 11109 / ASRB2) TaxID=880072 RepID=F2NHL6_DESAR|nr:hypothetical protein [Desulfobacca acetoxidans]AEB09203.1 hypothetical protein Desac_1346 [Desulfobacca acetoxidans DSM 11109]HAY23353.1 hypothetical protein [Desulfobacterales bacterium]
MKKTVWIAYDLGVKGDYEGLYSWLDNHGANECGHNIAVLEYDVKQNLIEELQKDIIENVTLSKQDRIYLIWREGGKIKGKFIVGKRKAAPWFGYGAQEPQIDEEVEQHG